MSVKRQIIRLWLLMAFAVIIVFGCSVALVHADDGDKIIDLEYTLSEEECHLKIEQATKIGSYTGGATTGNVYLMELPTGASITNITTSWATIKTRGVTSGRTWDNADLKKYTDESYYAKNNDFVAPSSIPRTGFLVSFTGVTFDESEYQLPTENVKGFCIQVETTDMVTQHRFFVQISTAGLITDKSQLKALIDSVPTSGFYTEGDTWNGKDSSTTGFWSELQSLKSEMQEVYDSTSYTQAQVNNKVTEFTASLDTAKANLIPDTQVLPVKIHEALETYKPLSESDKAKYSTKSVQKYENAIDAAETAYATLFDSEGNALTDTNKKERQEEIDTVADALEAAHNDLLGKSSEADIEKWLAAFEWVSSQEIKESDFTADSVNALNTAIQKAKDIEDAHEDPLDILASKTEYEAYTGAVAEALGAYYMLDNNGPITVHVRIVDNYGITHPEYAIDDSADNSNMANFDGDVTLTNHKTIQGLFLQEEGGLYTTPKTAYTARPGAGGIDDSCEHAHTYVYVNGKLAIPAMQADPTALARINPSAGHMDVYSGEDLSAGPVYSDREHENIEDRFPVLKNALHDGDDVVVLRTKAPFLHYYTSMSVDRCLSNYYEGIHLSLYYDSFGFLHIDDSILTDGFVASKPEDNIEIGVTKSMSDVITSKQDDTKAKEISVLASAPFSSREAAEQATAFTQLTTQDGEDVVDVLTDLDGKAEFSLAKEGWYRIAVTGIEGEIRVQDNYADPSVHLFGYYPYLAVSDFMLVHVSLDSEFEALKTNKGDADDAISVAGDAKTAYETSANAAHTAAATPGPEAVAASQKALSDAEAYKAAAEAAKDKADKYLAAVQALADKKDQLTSEHQTLIEEKLEEAKQMVDDAKAEKDAADAEAAKAAEFLEKTELKAELKACQDELEELNGEDGTISALNKKISDLQGQLDKLVGTDEEKGVIDTLKEQIKALEDELGLGSEEGKVLSNLQDQITGLQGNIDKLVGTDEEKGVIDTLKSQIEALEKELGLDSEEGKVLSNMKAQIDALDQGLKALNGEEGTIAAINAQIKALQDGAVSKEEVAALSGKVTGLQSQLDALTGENGAIASINAQIKALQDGAVSQEIVAALAGQVEGLQEGLAALNGEEGTIASINAQIKALQENTASKETVDKLSGQLADLQKELADRKTEIKDLNDKIAASQAEIDVLKATDPLAEVKSEAVAKVNKYLEDNADKILKEDVDGAELAALKAQITIKEAATEEAIKKAADDAIAKIGQKIAKAEAVNVAKAQKVKGVKVSVKKKVATIKWTADGTVSGYVVYRSLKKKSGFKKIATIKSNATTKYVNKKLVKGKTYYYKVRSFTKVDDKTYYGKYSAVKTTKKIK